MKVTWCIYTMKSTRWRWVNRDSYVSHLMWNKGKVDVVEFGVKCWLPEAEDSNMGEDLESFISGYHYTHHRKWCKDQETPLCYWPGLIMYNSNECYITNSYGECFKKIHHKGKCLRRWAYLNWCTHALKCTANTVKWHFRSLPDLKIKFSLNFNKLEVSL